MNPESKAWDSLRRHANARIRPGFADRVLRLARQGVEVVAPSIFSQFALCAATAALCFMAVAFFGSARPSEDNAQSLADWQDIAAATGDSGSMQ
jgi:hypothetical protein